MERSWPDILLLGRVSTVEFRESSSFFICYCYYAIVTFDLLLQHITDPIFQIY